MVSSAACPHSGQVIVLSSVIFRSSMPLTSGLSESR